MDDGSSITLYTQQSVSGYAQRIGHWKNPLEPLLVLQFSATTKKGRGCMVNKRAFIYLTAFSKTGGIEQFNKNVLAAFQQLGTPVQAISVYDTVSDERYFPANALTKAHRPVEKQT